MTNEFLYDAIVNLSKQLEADHDDPVMKHPDYRKVKALAACYELQEYLAYRIAAGRKLRGDLLEIDPESEGGVDQIESILAMLQELDPRPVSDVDAAWQDLKDRLQDKTDV